MSESPSNARHAMTAARTLVALFLGVGFSFIFLNQSFTPEQTNFENAAVTGAETTDTFGVVDGFLIHCFGSRNAQRCLDGQASRAPKSAALWLGNSQVHAVNQLQPGQVNAAPILFSSLSAQGLDLLTFSLPNANLQEHYVMFEYLRQHMPLKVLILPVCFDDMREEGVRSPDVSDFVHDAETRRILIGSDIGRRIIKSASTASSGDGNSNMSNETKGITGTIQEQVEKDLNAWLEEHSRLWRARPEIRGWLFYSVLYPLRNSLLGIKPSTTRKMIRSRYSNNRAALEETLRSAGVAGIRVALYIVPLRGGAEIPYDAVEYANFKVDIETLANRYGVTFENMESLVPNAAWGTKGSTTLAADEEVDYMHFSYSGHEILAHALHRLTVDAVLNGRQVQP
jgi:hypothetical protein